MWFLCSDCITNATVSSSKCAPSSYCLDGTVIKIINSNHYPGSIKFGKNGTPSGNFFFESTGIIVTEASQTIDKGYTCDTSGCTSLASVTGSYTFFNTKYKDPTCAFVDMSSSTNCKGAASQTFFDETSKKVIFCTANKCTLTAAAGHYINYGIVNSSNYEKRISCNGNTCEVIDKSAREFFINSGVDKSTKPIIYSDGTTYKTIIGDTSVVFYDTATEILGSTAKTYSNLIICQSTTKCTSTLRDNGIYLSPSNVVNDSTIQQIIKCSSSGCSELDVTTIYGNVSNVVYFVDGLSSKLIQCKDTSITCNLYNKDTSGKFYLDYATTLASSTTTGFGAANSGSLNVGVTNIISCDSSSICTSSTITSESQFIDGHSSLNLILCNTFGEEFFCVTAAASSLGHFYINSGNKGGDFPLLYCEGDKCVEKKASTVGYYMTDNGADIQNTPYNLDFDGYLISCSSVSKCELSSDIANNGYYINAGVNITGNPLIYFELDALYEEKAITKKDIYYLDASSLLTSSYTNLIYCSSLKNCTSIEPNDGYYYNADTDDNTDVIIKCDKTGCNIGDLVQTCTVDEDTVLKPGNYCYRKESSNNEDINFVVKEFTINSEDIDPSNQNITYVTSGSNYYYVSVNSGNFPGISNSISTLFEVRSNSITRVVADGIFIINSKHEQVESISGSINIGSTYTVYSCSSSTQLCDKTTQCKSGTYIFDEINNKGYQCDGNEMSPISEEGFYVDSSYIVDKYSTPGVLHCQDTGDCIRYTPTNTYFLNAGTDNNVKALIYCSNTSCNTQPGSIGYYRAEFGKSGVIVCTSSTSCSLSVLNYNYYINAGEDKYNKPIIDCSKNNSCETKKGTPGYYLIQDNNKSNLLINCKTSNSCEVEEGSIGYYYNSANVDNTSDIETVIRCYTSSFSNSVVCTTERKNEGFYLSGSENNVLINCMGSKCKSITVENGIFRSAATIKTSVKNSASQRDKFMDDELNLDNGSKDDNNKLVDRVGRFADYSERINKEGNVMFQLSESNLTKRASNSNEVVSSLIVCSGNVCNELTAEELSLIPVCTYNNDVCYLDNSNIGSSNKNIIITSVVSGDYCTDASRSTLYFAIETIVEYNDVISGVLSSSKTTTKNCIKASSQYSNNLFTIGNNIYRVNDGLITQVYDSGYYFININKNILVYGSEIKEYNNSNVLLYKCDGASCRIMEKPTSDTYYTDVTKRILKYSVEDDKYSFINKKENVCSFSNNTCTPKNDADENDFCITPEGNIVVVGEKIKSRETGKCFMSTSIKENVLSFSYNSVLYLLNSNAAKRVITSGYYFAENNKYYSAEYKAFNTTTSGITLYGCINSNCQIYEPQPDIYYFDMLTNYLIQRKDGEWISPIKVGYINVSISPDEVYIYSYTMSDNKELLLTKTTQDGWYYTIDGKMYQCYTRSKSCKEIEDSAYILTKSNELYYCVVDSEGEPTECFKRTCTAGQIYYIKDSYYRCSSGSFLELVRSRHCDHDEVVVINFPLIYSETFPIGVYNTISNIAKNNHYVPTQKISRNSLETIQGVFTNCTYNAYDEYADYDQICMQNFVKLNQDKEPDICSVKLLGYTYCTVDDGDDPDKCNPSSAFTQKYLSLWQIMIFVLSIIYIFIIY